MPVPNRVSALAPRGCPLRAAWRIIRRFHRLSARPGLVAYALRTRPPLSSPRRGIPVRLACIRPAASVHPEPGSNSSLYYCLASCFLSLGFRLRWPPSQGAGSLSARPNGRTPLVLASDYQRTRSRLPSSSLLSLRKRLQKYCFLPYQQAFFSNIFHYYYKSLYYNEINFLQ